jgi:hypothetical protein
LLIEESRQNIVLNSITLSSHTNSATTDTVTTETTSPDGTLNAYKVIGFSGTTTRQALASNSFTMNANSSYTASVFLKGTETRRYVVMWFDQTPPGNAPVEGPYYGSNVFIDLLTGKSTNSSVVKMVPYGNGWYRCSITATVGASNLTNVVLNVSIGSPNGFDDIGNPSIYKYVGDGASGIYYWGPQLEVGAFPTSYIPTVASTRTRAADNASITGKNFSEWYNQSEGSVYCRYNRIGIQAASTAVPTPWGVSDGTFSNTMSLVGGYSVPTARRFDVLNSGSATAQLDFLVTETAQTFNKVCAAYKLNDIAGSYNAQTVLTDTSSNIPSVNVLCIGRRDPASGNDYLNGNISQLLYYPRRLPNEQLQALTK